MREALYARQIHRRLITILDVPRKYRDGVMALLNEEDRKRMEALINGEEDRA